MMLRVSTKYLLQSVLPIAIVFFGACSSVTSEPVATERVPENLVASSASGRGHVVINSVHDGPAGDRVQDQYGAVRLHVEHDLRISRVDKLGEGTSRVVGFAADGAVLFDVGIELSRHGDILQYQVLGNVGGVPVVTATALELMRAVGEDAVTIQPDPNAATPTGRVSAHTAALSWACAWELFKLGVEIVGYVGSVTGLGTACAAGTGATFGGLSIPCALAIGAHFVAIATTVDGFLATLCLCLDPPPSYCDEPPVAATRVPPRAPVSVEPHF